MIDTLNIYTRNKHNIVIHMNNEVVTFVDTQDSVPCPLPFKRPHRLERSPDVFVNSIGISRQGDKNHPHLKSAPRCPIHQAGITTGSTTVFINGKGCGRIGDDVSACTTVASGSPNTFAGP